MAKTKHFGALAAAAGALVAVALLVLVLVVVNPQPAKAAFPGQNGRIAFASNRDGDYEIYTASSTGTEVGLFQRTNNAAFDTEPTYSPNGNRIAFASNRNATPNNPNNWDIFIVNSTGPPNLTQITTDTAFDSDPNWSPDGSRIVFSSNRGGNEQIWEVGSTGPEVNPDQITAGANRHLEPAYAPNGNRIVFQMFSDGFAPQPNWNIWTINSTGNPNSYERITDDPAADEEPAYSPDGSRIAFSSRRIGPPGNTDIFSADLSGDELVEIIGQFTLADDEKSAFSPDGRNIVFDSNRDGDYDIWIVHPSFQRPTFTRITNNPATDYAADWQSLP